MNLFLVRHTAVAVDEGVCYGSSDVPLAATFAQTAKLLRAKLPPQPWRVITSPAQRCRKLAESFGVPATIDARLLELNFGEWELRRWSDISREEIDFWSADFVNRAPPAGETFAALASRAEACVAEIAPTCADENILIITHGGVIRALLAPRRGLALREAFSIRVDFGGIHPLSLPAQTKPGRPPLTTLIV